MTDTHNFFFQPVKHELVEGDTTTLIFHTTPKMSSYLVAVVVGEFDYVEDKTPSGTVVRVYTPKGKSKQGEFALEVATRTLPFYDEYFGIPYPLPKIDCVAVPDFSAGAMENWGLCTFRESCILFDMENSSIANKQWIALVMTHELAHQWFGNLVTMKWWNDLWLNEGYATFTEYVCTGKLYPEYDTWQQFTTDVLSRALDMDALKNSHPIEVPIHNPNEIDEIFDEISYCKSASVIHMLYSWIGAADFMKGMNLYLHKYSYKNAETVDLWQSLEEASNKPVNEVMPTWTRQTGFPLLSVEQRQQGNDRVLSFKQQRFFADGSPAADDTLWMIPVNIATSNDPNSVALTTLIRERETEVIVPNVPEGGWIYINAGIIGFYRIKYSRDMLYALLPSIEDKTLSTLDRYGFLEDLFNCTKVGLTSTVDMLNVLHSFKQDDSYIVWNSVATCLSRIRHLITHLPIHEEFKMFGRKIYQNISKKVGWEAKPGESHLDTLLRSLILNQVMMLEDEEYIAEAKRRFKDHISGVAIIPADLRFCVYRAVVSNGDENTFNTMIDLYHKTELHEEKDRILVSLGSVRDLGLLKRVLEFSISEDVRAQDTMYVFQWTSWSVETQNFVWEFFKNNYDAYSNRLQSGILMPRTVKRITEDFMSEDKAKDVEEFFAKHPNSKLDRPVRQAIEKIRMNVEWLKRDKDAIEKFFKSQ